MEIQTSLLDLINYSIKELKRLNPSVGVFIWFGIIILKDIFGLILFYL